MVRRAVAVVREELLSGQPQNATNMQRKTRVCTSSRVMMVWCAVLADALKTTGTGKQHGCPIVCVCGARGRQLTHMSPQSLRLTSVCGYVSVAVPKSGKMQSLEEHTNTQATLKVMTCSACVARHAEVAPHSGSVLVPRIRDGFT